MNHNPAALFGSTTVSRLAVGAAGVALAVTLTGCGSSDTATDTADAGAGTAESASGFPGGREGGMPGAFGTIAAVEGDVLQVQSERTGQVAVTVAADTEITDQVAAEFSDVEVGACVIIQNSSDTGDAETDLVTAESVAISAGDDGCSAGPGGAGGAGEMPTERPTDMPTDMPSDVPSDAPEGRGGFGVAGEVTAVDANGFTVLAATPGDESQEETAVEVSDATTYNTEQAGDASALVVGRCVSATGEADETGAVTAEEITVSDPADGECAMGGFGGGRRGADGAGS